MINAIIDFLLSYKSGSIRKRSREDNTTYHRETVKPLKSSYTYGNNVSKKMVNVAKRRQGRK